MRNFELEIDSLLLKLRQGRPAIFPTDTIPALGICPEYAFKLWEIKQRALNKPLILMGSKKEQLFELVDSCALKDALEMASLHWPGALTMVLPAVGKEIDLLNPGAMTLGMRVPGNLEARELLEQIGPLATTSANISGESPCLTAEQACNTFPEIPILGPIPWPNPSGLASTVIRWENKGCWRVLRKGAVIPENIQ
tara:strand:+ start:1514 stop:2101 length:588 start_codon:yes stop_codon:yes gene_type:complete